MTADKQCDLFGWVFITLIFASMFFCGCVTMTKRNYEDQKSLSYTQGYVDGLFFCSGLHKKK